MAKQKKITKKDKEILKHYTSPDAPILPEGSKDSSKPVFIKPQISVDPVMSGRKNAVIRKAEEKKTLPSSKKNTSRDKKKDK